MQTKGMWLLFKVPITILYNVFLLFYIPVRYLVLKVISKDDMLDFPEYMDKVKTRKQHLEVK